MMDKELKDLIKKSLLGVVILLIIVYFLSHFIKEPVIMVSKLFIDYFGTFGVGLGICISDALPAFMIPDAFLVFAVAGNLPDLPVLVYSSVGSIIGGSISYVIGRFVIPRVHVGKKFIEKHEEKLIPYLEKYGVWAVVIAATTPLPYSWMSIIAGSFKMSFIKYLLASLFRIPRFAFYYYAIKLGWVKSAMIIIKLTIC